MRRGWLISLVCFLLAGGLALGAVLTHRESRLPPPRFTPDPVQTEIPAPPAASADTRRPDSVPEPTPMPWPEPDDGGLPEEALFCSEARRGYADGSLRLVIPKLKVDVPVLDGVDENTLLRGIGLYDYAQLPWETGGNVSIAGHRNWVRDGKITDDVPFYYLHTLGPGDCLYLTDGEIWYQYVWDKTSIIAPDDWSVIRTQGFSCLTLTTCTPIGVADRRYVVRARLADVLGSAAAEKLPAWLDMGTADPLPIPTEEVQPWG